MAQKVSTIKLSKNCVFNRIKACQWDYISSSN